MTEGLLSPGVSRGGHVAPVLPRASLRIVDACRCDHRHRNSTYFAKCCWPGAEVSGSGQLALIVRCDPLRVVLVERLTFAHTIHAEYAVFGCGAACHGDHELVGLDIDGSRSAA